MEVLFVVSWALIAVALLWAVVGLARYVGFARGERTLRPDMEAEAQPAPTQPTAPLPRPQLPDRERYQRARSRRVRPGEAAEDERRWLPEAGEEVGRLDDAATAAALERLDRFHR